MLKSWCCFCEEYNFCRTAGRRDSIPCLLFFLRLLDNCLYTLVFADMCWWTWIWRKCGRVIQWFCWWKKLANNLECKKNMVKNWDFNYQPQPGAGFERAGFRFRSCLNSSSQGGDSFYFGWRSLEDALEHRRLDGGIQWGNWSQDVTGAVVLRTGPLFGEVHVGFPGNMVLKRNPPVFTMEIYLNRFLNASVFFNQLLWNRLFGMEMGKDEIAYPRHDSLHLVPYILWNLPSSKIWRRLEDGK